MNPPHQKEELGHSHTEWQSEEVLRGSLNEEGERHGHADNADDFHSKLKLQL